MNTPTEIENVDSSFNTLTEFSDAWNRLTAIGVPDRDLRGKGLSLWKRIELYAKHLELFSKKGTADAVELAIQGKSAPPPPLTDPLTAVINRAPEVAERNEEKFPLSEDQDIAWTKMQAWAKLKAYQAPYFILRGYAGTGKTHLMKMLSEAELPTTVYFTAPTNKATKVLKAMLGRPARTIYSLLGLKMSNDDEQQELVWPDKMPELSYGCIIVIDEAGMVNKQLCEFIENARAHFNAKILYVGDPAQLPPVKEDTSPCWKATKDKAFRAFLKKVMRFDNQLLKLATHLRECVRSDERPHIEDDNDGTEGVFKMSERKFWKTLLKEGATPQDYADTKVIAWRNKTVNEYNWKIREHLGFGDSVYTVGDLLMVAKPIEVNGTIVATIDEDMVVEAIRDTTVDLKGYSIPVHELLVRVDSGPVLKLNIPTEDDLVLQTLLSELADKAKRTKDKNARRIRWREFWEANNKFHKVRYGYAMTAHRVQGSTYKRVFVDVNDILANQDTNTAYRCAYVAFTRPTLAAYTF